MNADFYILLLSVPVSILLNKEFRRSGVHAMQITVQQYSQEWMVNTTEIAVSRIFSIATKKWGKK